MENQLEQLRTFMAEIYDLERAAALLEWDQQTYMPPGGIEVRSEQIATLLRKAHEAFVSDRLGDLLASLSAANGRWEYDSDEASLIRETERTRTRKARLPAALVAALARAGSRGMMIWQQARAAADYEMFKPALSELLDLRRQEAECLGPYDHMYDPLLDKFEPGMKTADVQTMFDSFKTELIDLVAAISERADAVSNAILKRTYPVSAQQQFGLAVARQLGYDFARGRQDESAHPFTTSFSTTDVRITTRYEENWLPAGLFGTIHEVGHGLYEQGIAASLNRSGLQNGASLGMHESQSRLYENLIGRSRIFWQYYFPRLQAAFPHVLADVTADDFYRAINAVEPSLIRVEADEVTYNLHILIRFELEQALLTGDLSLDDLPEAWNDKYEAYLGLRPPNDAVGVLQDVHWSEGSIGYFPTYSIGNVISVQIWERIKSDIPDLEDQIARGQFETLRAWLAEKLHRHGKKFTPPEPHQRLLGGPVDSRPYMQYLKAKYGEIYGL
ncbi:MAG: carboxypeptidase M32 [Anaerolineales bacterium]